MINANTKLTINKIRPTLEGLSKSEIKEKKLASFNNLKAAIEQEIKNRSSPVSAKECKEVALLVIDLVQDKMNKGGGEIPWLKRSVITKLRSFHNDAQMLFKTLLATHLKDLEFICAHQNHLLGNRKLSFWGINYTRTSEKLINEIKEIEYQLAEKKEEKKSDHFSKLPNELISYIYRKMDDEAKLTLPRVSENLGKVLQKEVVQYRKNLWDNAIRSEKASEIISALARGARPEDLNKPIIFKGTESTLISIVLANLETKPHFELTDKLLQEGAILPEPTRVKADFKKISDFFRHLTLSVEDLYIHLRKNPALIKQQDEEGQTLLHTAIYQIKLWGWVSGTTTMLDLLFNAPEVDLHIKDKLGNTPIHTATINGMHHRVYRDLLPIYFSEAHKANYDFSVPGMQGRSVIHMAVLVNYEHIYRRNNVQILLDNAPGIDLNVLSSSSGSTALYYAISHLHFEAAESLLNAGADPRVFGNKKHAPLTRLNETIQFLKKEIKKQPDEEHLTRYLEESLKLKERILNA